MRATPHEVQLAFDIPSVPLTGEEVMRARDVADLLHVAKSTIHQWAREGAIPSHKRGRHRFFLRSEITAWLRALAS